MRWLGTQEGEVVAELHRTLDILLWRPHFEVSLAREGGFPFHANYRIAREYARGRQKVLRGVVRTEGRTGEFQDGM